jgi:hypothetical protein
VPPVLLVPAAVLVAVTAVTWRLARRLRSDVSELEGSTVRLGTLRAALGALDGDIDEARRRHGRLLP